MIHYAVLGSGSAGNSYAISDGKQTLLIDQGFSLIELKRRLAAFHIPFETVTGLCLTHLHPDHMRGAGTFARKTGKPVLIPRKAIEKESVVFASMGLPEETVVPVETEEVIPFGDFFLTAFPTSHDSAGSVGWNVRVGGRNLMFLTDTGITDGEEEEMAGSADVLFLEANHDSAMLKKIGRAHV